MTDFRPQVQLPLFPSETPLAVALGNPDDCLWELLHGGDVGATPQGSADALLAHLPKRLRPICHGRPRLSICRASRIFESAKAHGLEAFRNATQALRTESLGMIAILDPLALGTFPEASVVQRALHTGSSFPNAIGDIGISQAGCVYRRTLRRSSTQQQSYTTFHISEVPVSGEAFLVILKFLDDYPLVANNRSLEEVFEKLVRWQVKIRSSTTIIRLLNWVFPQGTTTQFQLRENSLFERISRLPVAYRDDQAIHILLNQLQLHETRLGAKFVAYMKAPLLLGEVAVDMAALMDSSVEQVSERVFAQHPGTPDKSFGPYSFFALDSFTKLQAEARWLGLCIAEEPILMDYLVVEGCAFYSVTKEDRILGVVALKVRMPFTQAQRVAIHETQILDGSSGSKQELNEISHSFAAAWAGREYKFSQYWLAILRMKSNLLLN